MDANDQKQQGQSRANSTMTLCRSFSHGTSYAIAVLLAWTFPESHGRKCPLGAPITGFAASFDCGGSDSFVLWTTHF